MHHQDPGDTRQLAEAGEGTVADNLATFVAAQYAQATLQLPDDADPDDHWNRLRALCRDVVGLRRSDQRAEWLRINRERLQMQQSKITHQKPMSPISPNGPISPIQAASS